jgi:hypothetical protein
VHGFANNRKTKGLISMSCPIKKHTRLSIPPRDKSVVAVPRPAIDENCAHREQVKNAFDFGFSRYEKAMEELSKV